MAQTTHYNLTKPEAGANNQADNLNANWDAIDAQMFANANAISLHIAQLLTAHAAANISSAAIPTKSTVEQAISYLFTAKSDTNHTHSGYATADQLATLESRVSDAETAINWLNPVLVGLTVDVSVSNIRGGLRIDAALSISRYVQKWIYTVKKGAIVIFSCDDVRNLTRVSEEYGFENGDDLLIQVKAWNSDGNFTTSDWISHTYASTSTQIDLRVAELEAKIGIGTSSRLTYNGEVRFSIDGSGMLTIDEPALKDYVTVIPSGSITFSENFFKAYVALLTGTLPSNIKPGVQPVILQETATGKLLEPLDLSSSSMYQAIANSSWGLDSIILKSYIATRNYIFSFKLMTF